MACPCTSGAETRTEFLNGLAPLSLLQYSLSSSPLPSTTNTPTPAHTLLLLQANSYHHPTCHIIKCLCLCFQGTVGDDRLLARTSHLSHILLTCVPFRKYPRHLFSGYIIPATLPNSSLRLPTSYQLLVYISKDSL